jgi:regulatory protein
VQARTPRAISQVSLEKTALWHLARRALTERQLEQILERKINRAARAQVQPRGALDVAAVIEKMRHLGFLDDARVAAGRASSMRDRGASRRKIAHKLRTQGVAPALIDDVARAHDELEAARTYARKRRLHEKDRDKALAALARQGFSYDVARRALEDSEAAHGPR